MSGRYTSGRPMLKLATAVPTWRAVTQLTPAMIVDHSALPAQSSTRTGTRATSFATPYVSPPIVPAMWVP